MVKCAVISCNERSKGSKYKFHSFPSEKECERRKAWFRACKRKEGKKFSFKSARICSKHFSSDCYADTLMLKMQANPELAKNLSDLPMPKNLMKGAVPHLYLSLDEELSSDELMPQEVSEHPHMKSDIWVCR